MKKSLLTIVLAFSFVFGGAALAPTVSEAHGYVASPGSRAFFGSSAGGNLNTN
ncbi:chitin-binding protein, partial [Enterococcus faecalis]